MEVTHCQCNAQQVSSLSISGVGTVVVVRMLPLPVLGWFEAEGGIAVTDRSLCSIQTDLYRPLQDTTNAEYHHVQQTYAPQ